MDKSKPKGKADDTKRQRHSREFKIEAVRQLEEGKVRGTQLALMLGVKRSIIYRWKKELATHGPDVSFPGTGKARTDGNPTPQARVGTSHGRARNLKKKSGSVLCAGTAVMYAFVQAHQQQFRVARLCRALHVSRSGFYDWQRREPLARQQEDIKLLAAIERTHQTCRQAYGAEKTWRALNASGVVCGKHRVARLRRQAGIGALRKRRFRRLEKHSLLGPAPNRLQR